MSSCSREIGRVAAAYQRYSDSTDNAWVTAGRIVVGMKPFLSIVAIIGSLSRRSKARRYRSRHGGGISPWVVLWGLNELSRASRGRGGWSGGDWGGGGGFGGFGGGGGGGFGGFSGGGGSFGGGGAGGSW